MHTLEKYSDAELAAALEALSQRLRRNVDGMTADDRKRARVRLKMAARLQPRQRRVTIGKWLDAADPATRGRVTELLAECGVST